jgi:8-oxo-dGTP pyrophosphatase MutT (NUDIX family)
LDDFDFLETIDLTEDIPEETPSGKRRRPNEVESAMTSKTREPTSPASRTPIAQGTQQGLSANLHTPQLTRKQINDKYDSELLDLELEIRRRKIEIARRETLEEAGFDPNG